MKKWWEKPVRMMRWDYLEDFSKIKNENLEELARKKKEEFHINCEWIDGTLPAFPGLGHITTFQAEGFERYPGLEDFDSLREYLPYAHKYGIKLIVYLNMHYYSDEFGREHTDWEQTISTGESYGNVHPLYGSGNLKGGTTFCVNSPWREWAFKLFRETMKTGVDGVFSDGPSVEHQCCYCKYCRNKFRERYGEEIPIEDWQNPLWRDFIDFRDNSITEFLKDGQSHVLSVNPEGVFFLNSNAWHSASWRSARDPEKLAPYQSFSLAETFFSPSRQRQNLYKAAITAKCLAATGKPAVPGAHYCMGPWHFTFLSPEEVKLYIFQSAACGGNTWVGGDTYRYQFNPEGGKPAHEALKFLEDNEEFYTDTSSLAKTAVLFSTETNRHYICTLSDLYTDFGTREEEDLVMDGGTGKTIVNWPKRKGFCQELINFAYEGYCAALTRSHIPFDIILDMGLKNLDRYELLILPDFTCVSDENWEKIADFVEKGGHLISSFEAGFYDERGERKSIKERGRLLGIDDVEGLFPPIRGDNYIITEKECFGFKSNLLIERSPYALKVKEAKGVTAPFYFMNPVQGPLLPLLGKSHYPAVLISNFGNGKVIYFPSALGTFYGEYRIGSQEDLIKETVKHLIPLQLEVKAPVTLEVEIYQQRKLEERVIIHLLNLTGDMQRPLKEIIPLYNIEISLKTKSLTKSPKRLYKLSDKESLPFSREDGKVRFSLPELRNYDVIVIE